MKRPRRMTFMVSTLLMGTALTLSRADSPVGRTGSDLRDKAWIIQADYAASLARLKSEMTQYSRQVQCLNVQSSNAKSPEEIARLDYETARLGRLLAQDHVAVLGLEASLREQASLRAGEPFPGAEIIFVTRQAGPKRHDTGP